MTAMLLCRRVYGKPLLHSFLFRHAATHWAVMNMMTTVQIVSRITGFVVVTSHHVLCVTWQFLCCLYEHPERYAIDKCFIPQFPAESYNTTNLQEDLYENQPDDLAAAANETTPCEDINVAACTQDQEPAQANAGASATQEPAQANNVHGTTQEPARARRVRRSLEAATVNESVARELEARLHALDAEKQHQEQEHLKKMELLEMKINQCREKHDMDMTILKLVQEREQLQIKLLQKQLNS